MTKDEIIEMARQAGMVQDCCDMWFSPGKGDMDVEHEHLEAFAKLVAAKAIAELESQERNFCPRCGKRTNDIHTCTPPQEKNNG
jgi:hypothetical protein